ncbi:MAG: DNA mismatch repair protein MutS [Bdellovibrionaceae bacterium]|nr:DNA mismatch repair protein MutS [Pseudobdellovibrionaceae bacterium]
MQQYWEVKEQHPDKLILFRMGDFFEMFHDDAVIAAPILNIALTQRNKKSNDETPMCGVPHHSIATPISKLLKAGHKVAICDQLEDPKQAKGLVKRGVTQVLTPGMVFDSETLNGESHNYITSFDNDTVAFAETSTGEVFYFNSDSVKTHVEYIRLIGPVEIVFGKKQKESFASLFSHCSAHASECNGISSSLPDRFQNSPESVQRLVTYIQTMQGDDILLGMRSPEKRGQERVLKLSERVVQHLELFENYRGSAEGTLFESIRRTKTSAGARLLKQWLKFPLVDSGKISLRWDRVEHWQRDIGALKSVRSLFSKMGDIERRLGKIAGRQGGPKDVVALADSLEQGLGLSNVNLCRSLSESDLSVAKSVLAKIRKTIEDEPPQQFKNGGVIRRGVHPQLDEYIDLSENSKQLLLEMEQKEREAHEIPSLKIKYNNVFGYFIEVTNTHKDKVPSHYKRKQTLTNAERYVTQELHELEGKILGALSKRVELENEIFSEVRQYIIKHHLDLLNVAQLWAEIDVLSSFAWVALEYNYCRPTLVDSGIDLVGSRHPVVEQSVKVPFVSNDISIKQGHCILLTGPNMAGKSTVMRQVALTVILAQIGSFVPASSAEVQLYHSIFTRVGASDFLSEGLSTFMVEMVEAADILQDSGSQSLVVMDEIGRGTSTYDGMSLAQSILEFLVEQKQSTVLFATHYHELTRMESRFQQIHNMHMSIKDKDGEVMFLHTLVDGAANRSYGIQVARLAGLPRSVTRRAQKLLEKMESFNAPSSQQMTLLEVEDVEPVIENESIPENLLNLIENIKNTSIQSMTPLEAINKIAEWQRDLS